MFSPSSNDFCFEELKPRWFFTCPSYRHRMWPCRRWWWGRKVSSPIWGFRVHGDWGVGSKRRNYSLTEMEVWVGLEGFRVRLCGSWVKRWNLRTKMEDWREGEYVEKQREAREWGLIYFFFLIWCFCFYYSNKQHRGQMFDTQRVQIFIYYIFLL
jgi:hypothetical protein